MLSENIKLLIYQKGYKQKAIAEKIGVGERKFSNMLNGRKKIDIEYVVPIADALGVTPNDLFYPKTNKPTR